MKIAMVGIRGIPVIYSGFETVAEKLAVELVKKKHSVTVYCRKPYVNPRIRIYKGVDLVSLPVFQSKNWETFFHSFLATFHACFFSKPDIIYYFGVGSSLFSIFPRFFGIKTVVNVDGLDWKREKWGRVGRWFLGFSEYLATVLPTAIITDSLYIQSYYKTKFRKSAQYIPYGFFDEYEKKDQVLNKFHLQKNGYFVWVGRLVPDNHTEELIHAFRHLKTTMKCVIVGDDLYQSSYKNHIRKLGLNDKRIIFTGFLSREDYANVVRNSFAYVETKRSFGAHPSLIEAMGFGCFIISCDNETHKEILGETALFYSSRKNNDLEKQMCRSLSFSKKDIPYFRKTTYKIAKNKFSWRYIIESYEKFFLRLIQSSE